LKAVAESEETLDIRERDFNNAVRSIIEKLMLLEKPGNDDLNRIKMQVCRQIHTDKIPSNAEIISQLRPEERSRLIPLLRRKPVRTISGIAVVAVMTRPERCPHGRCAYCPGGPEEGVPQSYTGKEPAAMRGAQNDYDPYRQVRSRLTQLQAIGHDVDKTSIIVMGGTFPATSHQYQRSFLKGCLEGLIGRRTDNLEEAIRRAETSSVRNVGITVETRPDSLSQTVIDSLLAMGITRVEIGVQNIYNDIYELVGRGHRVEDVIEATRLLKDSGLKVCYHMMPGLPGSDPGRDLEGFKTIFADERYKPDMIKIYPCLVLKGTELYRWWQRGEYSPYSDQEAIELISEVKSLVPPWIRIMRVQRDIPSNLIVAGVKHSNLRQLAKQRIKEKGKDCRCIRCREIGHRRRERKNTDLDRLEMRRLDEDASRGREIFLSYELEDSLVAFLRLRIPSCEAGRPEIRERRTSIVRELRVLGQTTPIGERKTNQWQHQGIGSELLSKAEQISKEEFKRHKILITSAIGTRDYYRRFGYKLEGPYMSKDIGE